MSQFSPSPIFNTGPQFADYIANINVSWYKGFEEEPNPMWQFYEVKYEGPNAGTSFRYEEPAIGSGFAQLTQDGEPAKNGQFAPGYFKDALVQVATYTLPMTWKMIYHNKYPEQIAQFGRDAGEATARVLHYDMVVPFGFGESSTYTPRQGGFQIDLTSGDSLSFFNTAHTLTGSAITYRNILAGNPAYSTGSLQAMETMIAQNIFDNNGIRRTNTRPTTLLHGSDATTRDLMMKDVKSVSPRDEVNSNVINPEQGRYTVIEEILLDSKVDGTPDSAKLKRWVVCNSVRRGIFLVITENPHLVVPTEANGGRDYFTRTESFFSSTTYDIRILDPRCAFLSLGNLTA